MMPDLYHGTAVSGLRTLMPVPSSVVHLTPSRAYALFYIMDKDVGWVTCGVKENGVVRYEEQFPNQMEILYRNARGSLYTAAADDGMKMAGKAIWTSTRPVAVLAEEHIADVYAALLAEERAGCIAVNRYADATDERKRDIRDMMVHYIYKHDLAAQTTKKTRFIRDNFPAAWAEAASHPEMRQAVLEEWENKHDRNLQARH